jgi:hypothetical protein
MKSLTGCAQATNDSRERSKARLAQAYELRDPALIWLRSFERLWHIPLGHDGRYRDLLRRMRLEP